MHVPEKAYLAIDGSDAPGGEGFIAAIGALYGSAYRLLYTLKARGVASHVGMLEGLYWLTPEELMEDAPTDAHRAVDRLRWRLPTVLYVALGDGSSQTRPEPDRARSTRGLIGTFGPSPQSGRPRTLRRWERA